MPSMFDPDRLYDDQYDDSDYNLWLEAELELRSLDDEALAAEEYEEYLDREWAEWALLDDSEHYLEEALG